MTTCGEAVPGILRRFGVDVVFGMPGVHNLEFYRGLAEAGLRHVGVRHEQGAGFMADGYARATGRPGVCLLIGGPGVTNAATPLGQAFSDSIPILVLSAAISQASEGLGRGMLHEITDQAGVTRPLTQLSAVVRSPAQLGAQIVRTFTLFQSVRPRPVHIAVPIDVLSQPHIERAWSPDLFPTMPVPSEDAIERASACLRAACSPVILIGGGAAAAGPAIVLLAERLGAAVVTTVAGKGVIPDSHPLSLGSTLQRAPVRRYIEAADVVLAIGSEIAEPDLYVTADAEAEGSDAAKLDPLRLSLRGKLVRIDIDPGVASSDPATAVSIIGDAAAAVAMLNASLASVLSRPAPDLSTLRQQSREGLTVLERRHIAVLEAVRAGLPADAVLYADMTQIAYTGCVFYPTAQARSWHFPVGFGTLGYALPAAIGGKIGLGARSVAAIVGDGGFLFTIQELCTAVEERLSLPIVLWDNDGLGEIGDFMRARAIPRIGVRPKNPDFLHLARACGANAVRPTSLDELRDAVSTATQASLPTVILVREDAPYLRNPSQ